MADWYPQLDLKNNQGNIFGGFNKDFQAFLFLRFPDQQAQSRAWLRAIVPQVATSDEVVAFNTLFKQMRARRGGEDCLLKATWMNVAFTYQGFQALGVPDEDLKPFPADFRGGMKARAEKLGDVGPNDPSHWVEPFASGGIHAVMLLASDTEADLETELKRQRAALANYGIQELGYQEGRARQDMPGHEHFGFKDGISQPGIAGVTVQNSLIGPTKGDSWQDLIQPWEIVLSYPRQTATSQNGSSETLASPVPEEIVPASTSGPGWSPGGSYLVFRRLRQDVKGFQDFVIAQATTQGIGPDLMAAKLIGRYKSGAPLEPSGAPPPGFTPPTEDPGETDSSLLDDSRINNFGYSDDPDGRIVPHAAHIRKVHPRDGATPDGGAADTQTHRLLRRGISFGQPFDEKAPPDSPQGPNPPFPNDRGLLFLCYQSSIEQQFEHVLARWVNDPDFPARGDGQDPIVSHVPLEGGANRSFRLPGGKVEHVALMQQFVTTTGGEYFFQPSLVALRALSAPQPQDRREGLIPPDGKGKTPMADERKSWWPADWPGPLYTRPALRDLLERAKSDPALLQDLIADPLGTCKNFGVGANIRAIEGWLGMPQDPDPSHPADPVAVIDTILRLLKSHGCSG